MSAAPILTILKDGETIRSQPVEGVVSIGRAEGNVIRLEDRAISRQHAILRAVADGVQIEKRSDFGAISVNGAECSKAVVRMGDIISIGPFMIRVEAQKKSEAAAPAAVPVMSAIPAMAPDPDAGAQPTVILTEPSEPTPEGASLDFAQTPSPLVSPILPEQTPVEEPLGLHLGGEAAPGLGGIDLGATDESQTLEPASQETASADVVSDEDAKTRVVSIPVDARIFLVAGEATPAEFDISKAEITIGRGKNCDIVLQDKKSSRQNSRIVKDGVRYIVRDLNSSNGTYVNGKQVKEKVLSSEDRIRIGDCEFRFVAENPHYEKQAQEFLPVPDAPEGTPQDVLVNPIAPEMGVPGADPFAAPGVGLPPQAPAEKKGFWKIYDKYIRNFKTLKPMQKLLVVLVGLLFALWFFEEEPEDLNQAQTTEQADVQKKNATGKAVKGVANLTPEQRKFVETQYNLAFEFYTKKDYDKALYEVQKIFPLAPDHERGKELERYILEAKRMRDAIEAERKKKEEETRLKARIASLKEEIQGLMDRGEYDDAKERFAEILEIDPEDAQVAEWRARIDAFFEEQERIAQEKRVQEEINKAAQDTFDEADALHKASKFHEAIKIYGRVGEMGSSNKSLIAKAKARVQACLDEIRDRRDPVLQRARELEKEEKLAEAFREYEKATRIDPPHPDGYAGMERIRGILTDQAKTLYTEAVIAESYSDFDFAYQKFKTILETAPQGSVYYERAQRKIANYKHFKPEGGAESTDSAEEGEAQ